MMFGTGSGIEDLSPLTPLPEAGRGGPDPTRFAGLPPPSPLRRGGPGGRGLRWPPEDPPHPCSPLTPLPEAGRGGPDPTRLPGLPPPSPPRRAGPGGRGLLRPPADPPHPCSAPPPLAQPRLRDRPPPRPRRSP